MSKLKSHTKFEAASPSTTVNKIRSLFLTGLRSEAFVLLIRQAVSAIFFFAATFIVMSHCDSKVYADFVKIQNLAYLIVAAVLGGLQPTIVYMLSSGRTHTTAMFYFSIRALFLGSLFVLLASIFGHSYIAISLPAIVNTTIALMISSTISYIFLGSGRVNFFGMVEIIPSGIFLLEAFRVNNSTSADEIANLFAASHWIKSVVCIAILMTMLTQNHSKQTESVPHMIRYMIKASLTGVIHVGIQRSLPLIITAILPISTRSSVLAAWSLLDKVQAFQQSINLAAFRYFAKPNSDLRKMIPLIFMTAIASVFIGLTLAGLVTFWESHRTTKDYAGMALAIAIMIPGFVSANLRLLLQSLTMARGKVGRSTILATVTLVSLGGALIFNHFLGTAFGLSWIFITFTLSAASYFFLLRN